MIRVLLLFLTALLFLGVHSEVQKQLNPQNAIQNPKSHSDSKSKPTSSPASANQVNDKASQSKTQDKQQKNQRKDSNQEKSKPATKSKLSKHNEEDEIMLKALRNFDSNKDGVLNETEVLQLLKSLKFLRNKQIATNMQKNNASHLSAPSSSSSSLSDASFSRTQLPPLTSSVSSSSSSSPSSPSEDHHHERDDDHHDVTVDGEVISMDDSDFELLFKQLSNLKATRDPSKDPRTSLQEDIIFLQDVVILSLAAAFGGMIALKIGLPPIIGFIVSGMFIGPGGFGYITELVEMETLASLGIAFILFSLGIEFSIKELRIVKRIAVYGGFFSLLFTVLAFNCFGWFFGLMKSFSEATALALSISLSSTAVVLQCLSSSSSPTTGNTHSMVGSPPTAPINHATLPHASFSTNEDFTAGALHSLSTPYQTVALITNEKLSAHDTDDLSIPVLQRKLIDTPFDSLKCRKVILALLVFQDMTIGLILAMIPALQGTLMDFAQDACSACLRLGCFAVLALAFADFVLPTYMDRLYKARSLVIFSLGVFAFCLLVAYTSDRFGLAIELGAFTAGLMLSESAHKRQAERSVETIRDIFSAVFFVAIGMMIHWRYFYNNFVKMACLLLFFTTVKTVAIAIAAQSFAAMSRRTALAVGITLAQAGEFTFVVTSRCHSLHIFSTSQTRMINGATALSMLITPLLVRYARKLPRAQTVLSADPI